MEYETLSAPLLLALTAGLGVFGVASVSAVASSTRQPSLLAQLTRQLAGVVVLDEQQRALLAAVSERSQRALASVVHDQLERRLNLVDHLERAAAAQQPDDATRHAVARSWRAIREGRLTALAAGLAVAADVDTVLTPEQRLALEHFSPRLSTPSSTKDAVRSLLERIEHIASSSASGTGHHECGTGPVERELEALLTDLALPTEITTLVVRHVSLSLRLAVRPSWSGTTGVADLAQITRVCQGLVAALGGSGSTAGSAFSTLAQLLDSPLLPAVAQQGRLKRHALELVMISSGFLEEISRTR